MDKKKELSPKRRALLQRLESIIGNSCYNSNIQNYGPGGEWEGEGRDFRYPIVFRGDNGQKIKVRDYSSLQYLRPLYNQDKLTDAMWRNGSYLFGANELHIMDALIRILDLFEKEYGLVLDDEESDSA